MVVTLCFSLYVAVGILLDFHYKTFNGDATSRLANAFYVLYSRDPHLAAVGFVWNPGTSIIDLVPLLFYHLWTPLATHAFGASLASAFCMAGAVYQVDRALAEWGVPRAPRLVMVIILALNGMILYYGGDGMSEGLYLFTLLATCRYLLRWLRDGDLASLVYSATAIGLCYLARNEAVGPALAAGVVVLGVSYGRGSVTSLRRDLAPRSARIWGALTDLAIFEIPIITTLVGWAVASYVITGQAFGQFTSIYGTAAQLSVIGSNRPDLTLHARILHDIRDVSYLAPTLPVLLILAVFCAARRRDIGILAPLAVVGSAVAFDGLAYVSGSIAWWFRYFIAAIPLEVLLAGCIFATAPAVIGLRRPTKPQRSQAERITYSALAVVAALILLVPSSVTTLLGMKNPNVGFEEVENLGYIYNKHLPKGDETTPATWPGIERMSSYFAGMHLHNGQIVVDNFTGCVPDLILRSPNPKIYVIPNDRDFQRILNDPVTFHAQYILEANPVDAGTLTSINRLYPALWKNGAGFAKEVHSFPTSGRCFDFRLFKVLRHPNSPG